MFSGVHIYRLGQPPCQVDDVRQRSPNIDHSLTNIFPILSNQGIDVAQTFVRLSRSFPQILKQGLQLLACEIQVLYRGFYLGAVP